MLALQANLIQPRRRLLCWGPTARAGSRRSASVKRNGGAGQDPVRTESAVQQLKAGLGPKRLLSKLKELQVLLPDVTEAHLLSSLTMEQLVELCEDTAAVAKRMVELKVQAPKVDLASILCSWPVMLTKEHCGSFLLGHAHDVLCVAVSADGRLAVTGGRDATLRVWDLHTCACLAVLKGHTEWVRAVAVTPDGRRAASIGNDMALRVWDLEAYACTATIASAVCLAAVASARTTMLAVSPDGKHAVLGASDDADNVAVWDLEAQVRVACMEGHIHDVSCVAVSPDGRRAVSGSSDHTLRVWDLQSKTCTAVLQGHKPAQPSVLSVAFTPDGRRAVSASWDRTLRLWCVESGTCVAVFEGAHTHLMAEVAVTHDGRHVVSASWDGDLRVWSLETLACVSTKSFGRTNVLRSVAVLPDGRVVVAGCSDPRVVRILRLPGLP